MSIKERVTDKQLQELIEINCLWNNRKLDPNRAMSKIWKLFEQENLALWNRSHSYKRQTSDETQEVKR